MLRVVIDLIARSYGVGTSTTETGALVRRFGPLHDLDDQASIARSVTPFSETVLDPGDVPATRSAAWPCSTCRRQPTSCSWWGASASMRISTTAVVPWLSRAGTWAKRSRPHSGLSRSSLSTPPGWRTPPTSRCPASGHGRGSLRSASAVLAASAGPLRADRRIGCELIGVRGCHVP